MLSILFEDNYLLAIDKPPGLQVERDRWGNPNAEDQVAEYLRTTFPWKKQLIAGVVHRLDRPVSGVLLFAKTRMALKTINLQFEQRVVRKTYLALVENTPSETKGELVHWLRKDSANKRAQLSSKGGADAKRAHLRYRVVESAGRHSLLEVQLLTGRYHQVRAQLSAIGCPIVGDEKYGSVKKTMDGELALRAHVLTVNHPKTGEPVRIEAPRPSTGIWER